MFKRKLIAKNYDHRSRPQCDEIEDHLFTEQPLFRPEDNILLEVLSPNYFPDQEIHYSIQDFIRSLQTEQHIESPPLEEQSQQYPSTYLPLVNIAQVNSRYLMTMGDAWQPSPAQVSQVKWSGQVRMRYFCGQGAAVEINDEEQYTSFDMKE